MHRDLKLENIGVIIQNFDNKNIKLDDFKLAQYKLLDFGFSKLLNDD